MANDYTFHQIATVLNELVADAQGKTANITTTPRNTAEFVTMGTTALSLGLDPIMNSLTQMIHRTITSYRPYNRKFSIVDMGDINYGNAIRKITPVFSSEAEDQPMYNDAPADGSSVDQWKVKRPQALQTMFVGADQWMIQAPTMFVDQLKTAFRGPDELMAFLASQTGEVMNEVEQEHEVLARATVANMIAATQRQRPAQVYNLLSLYNSETGQSLTIQQARQSENYPAFIKWAFAFIETISDQMEERGVRFHVSDIGGYTITRHTPKADQRLILYSPWMNQIQAEVRTGLYNNGLLTIAPHESVTFWQNPSNPAWVNVTPSILNADGTVSTGEATSVANIFGVLYDRSALGSNIISAGVNTTPVNAAGKYYNTYHHFVKRHFNDQTENFVVFTWN